MYAFLLVIHVIVSLFLIFIILIQSGKGEGLSDVFGGGSSQTTIFGSRTGNFLTKATTASAIIFMVTCLSLALISKRSGGSIVQQELLKEQTVEKVQQMLGDKEAASEEAA
ncbi:MAG: preprotein translocase subunit SecG, partial [Candidatus Omnitrophica bacterium]|nr:preprotein translocase subunit SecG [Candidatus Omnitrophota bacterium]